MSLKAAWPWLQLTDPERTWAGSKLPCDDADMALFRASTKITIGNGKLASFWHDNWKNRTDAKELSDNNWIRSVITISMPTQLAQYLELWDIIQSVTLVLEQPDSISWTLTSDATYSASFA
ncbi:uncharacterized protein [Lolium perenne]|uniref:uncharacterized protein n=1 Tax=Lolium perenne TaxID=4522 RepID=UPI0021F6333E|nr:uncharacterized protein LOC127315330 [Lolium perenne]